MDQNSKTALKAAGLVLFMGGLAWASVPLYDWFCRVTGYGGVTQVADAASTNISNQTIKIRFDASKDRGFPWEFKPTARTTEIRIGETGLAFYEAYNPTDKPIAGTASFNVYPYSAGAYFNKVQCFCFELQVLQPGERVQMPVSYFVDPDILEDREAKFVKSITLSYTFHETDLPDPEQAALAGGETSGLEAAQ
ncbi:MAG: cytochrome c oxidase assembly protein [Pseudomonadota bacterium]